MLSFFSPQSGPTTKDSALVAWKEAAESWGWLGAALLFGGRADAAKDAVERAVRLRLDFWWARDVAMPQAVHSRLGEDQGLLEPAGSR